LNILPLPFIFYIMDIFRPLRGGLFVYECLRLLYLIGSFVVLRPGGGNFPWLVYAAPNALFPLAALFLWLDISRYGLYLPLYVAGKGIGVCSMLGWLISSRWLIPPENITGLFYLFEAAPALAGWILLCGDLLSVAAGLVIAGKTRNLAQGAVTEAPAQPPATGGE
jgi:hypothetical protein